MKKGLLTAFYGLVHLSCWVNAQSGISGELKTEYIPHSSYIRPEDSVKTNSKSDFKRVDLSFSIPLSVKKTEDGKVKAWSLLVNSSYAKMSHKNYENSLFPDQMLNTQVGLFHIRPLGGKWSMMITASAGVYTDLKNVNFDDVLGQGGILFVKNFSPNLALGAGPLLTTAFGVPMIMPWIYFDWKTGNKIKFKINFPEGMEAGYQFTDKFALKAVVGLNGMTVERNKGGKSTLLGYQQITAGLRPELQINKNLSLRLTGGTALLRSFNENDRKIKSIFKAKKMEDPRFASTFYMALSLRWNLP
jgi:roadblock/LC7 domain-containing protein